MHSTTPAEGYDDPDRWHTRLPMPYSMIDELLTEMIDDVLLRRSIADAALSEEAKPEADSVAGAVSVAPPLSRALPEQLAGAGADSLLATLAEGVYAVALTGGGLWLWDAADDGAEPLHLGDGVDEGRLALGGVGDGGALPEVVDGSR